MSKKKWQDDVDKTERLYFLFFYPPDEPLPLGTVLIVVDHASVLDPHYGRCQSAELRVLPFLDLSDIVSTLRRALDCIGTHPRLAYNVLEGEVFRLEKFVVGLSSPPTERKPPICPACGGLQHTIGASIGLVCEGCNRVTWSRPIQNERKES